MTIIRPRPSRAERRDVPGPFYDIRAHWAMQWWAPFTPLLLLLPLSLLSCERVRPIDIAEATTGVHAATAAQYAATIAELGSEIEKKDGLLAGLRGISEAPPRVVIITDTVEVPDTVIQVVAMGGDGLMDVGGVTIDPNNRAQGEGFIFGDIDISRCDDGFTVSGTTTVCNKARLGHLYLGATLGTATDPVKASMGMFAPEFAAGLSVWWEPYFRSPFSIEAGYNFLNKNAEARLRLGKRIF